MPGFIDTHVNFPQTDMIGLPSPSLLPWLKNYVFLTKRRFSDPAYAVEVANFFLIKYALWDDDRDGVFHGACAFGRCFF